MGGVNSSAECSRTDFERILYVRVLVGIER